MSADVAPARAPAQPSPTSVFEHVVGVVDGSSSALRAVRIAARVCAPGGHVAVVPLDEVGGHLGHRFDSVVAELERQAATLAVIRLDERNRAVGIAVGSVATHLLHDAPCSVLVVPDGLIRAGWPRTIAVGLDGSTQSAGAVTAAWELAERAGSKVRAVAATGRPGHADLELVRRIAPDFEAHDARPVTALAEISEDVDLVVVGSRGLRGVRALGSVSERIAHEAHCPVLVVRTKGEES